jgi:hypothetical protein
MSLVRRTVEKGHFSVKYLRRKNVCCQEKYGEGTLSCESWSGDYGEGTVLGEKAEILRGDSTG